MPSLQEAFIAAMRLYRGCAIVHTVYKGFQAVELDDDAFTGRPIFIIPENGATPIPCDPDAKRFIANMVCEAIGGKMWKEDIEKEAALSKGVEPFQPLKFLIKDKDILEYYYPLDDAHYEKFKKKPAAAKPKKKIKIRAAKK